MKRIPILTAVAFACVCAVSCKNAGVSGLPIPKDALMVMDIDASSLTSKLTWKEIQQSNWYQEMRNEAHDSAAKHLFDDPESSGVDLKSHFIYFIKKQGRGGYMTFEGRLKDAGAFEANVKKIHDNPEIKKDGDLTYMVAGTGAVICWTSKQFFVMNDAPMSGADFSNYGGGMPAHYTSDSLRYFAHGLVDLKKSNSIEDDDRFASLIKESGDMHVWISNDQYANNGFEMLQMMKFSSLIRGSISTFTINFDNGKVTGKVKQYYNDEMKKLMADYKPQNIDAALVNRAPAGSVAVMAAQMDPKLLSKVLQAGGVDGMVNGYLGKFGANLNDIISATDGKILMAVSGQPPVMSADSMNAGGMYRTSSFFPGTLIFATSVKDRAKFSELLGIVQHESTNEGRGNIFTMFPNKLGTDWFAIGNNQQAIDNFIGGTTTSQPFASKITGHPFGLYVDMQGALKTWYTRLSDHSDSVIHEATMALWKEIVVTGGEMKDGVAVSDFSLNLMDGSTNSLKQFNAYGEKVHAAQEEQRRRYRETWDLSPPDSTVPAPTGVQVAPVPDK